MFRLRWLGGKACIHGLADCQHMGSLVLLWLCMPCWVPAWQPDQLLKGRRRGHWASRTRRPKHRQLRRMRFTTCISVWSHAGAAWSLQAKSKYNTPQSDGGSRSAGSRGGSACAGWAHWSSETSPQGARSGPPPSASLSAQAGWIRRISCEVTCSMACSMAGPQGLWQHAAIRKIMARSTTQCRTFCSGT